MSINTSNTYTSPTNFKNGEFHHAVLSISGTVHTLFLDGVQVAQNTNAGNILSNSSITNTTIGCLTDTKQAFRGFIGDFKVYNKVINATEVSNLYLNRNLVVYYPFDVYVNKYTPNNALLVYDATFVGTATTTSNSLIGTGALSLTNTARTKATSYVESSPILNGNTIPLNSSTGLTISCWVNTLGLTNTDVMCLFDIPSATGKKGISVDICGNNMIYSTALPPPASVPSNLSLIGVTNYSADITFTMSNVNPFLTYSVISSPSATTIVTGNNTVLDISGLAPNTIYTINVVASTVNSSSTPSSAFSLTTSDFSTGYNSSPCYMDFSGNYLYFPNYNTNTIIQTNLSNGTIANSTFISNVAVSGGGGPSCCVVYNNNLYVSTAWFPLLQSYPGNVDTIYIYNLLSPGTRTNLFSGTPYSCIQSFFINNNNLYFLATGGGAVVRCYSLTTNSIVWTSITLSYGGTDLVLCNGNIYVSSYDGYITKINSTNGNIISNNWYYNSSNMYSLSAYNTYLYVGNPSLATIIKIDTSSGSANVINLNSVSYVVSPISIRIYNNYMYVSNGYRIFKISIP